MGHARGAPYHPQTQGKIEQWHHTQMNCILLDNYFFLVDLVAYIEALVEHHNFLQYYKSINNLIPAVIYFGCGLYFINRRERTKRKTIRARCLQCRKCASQ